MCQGGRCVWSCTGRGTWQGSLQAGDRTVVKMDIPGQRASTIRPYVSGKGLKSVICWDVRLSWGQKAPLAVSFLKWSEDRNRNESDWVTRTLAQCKRTRWLWVTPRHVCNMCPSTASWKCSCTYSFWQSEKYSFVYVPKKMVSSCQTWQLRWENTQLLPGVFRNIHTHPAYVGQRFITKFCKGCFT